jgi:acyl carrier protein
VKDADLFERLAQAFEKAWISFDPTASRGTALDEIDGLDSVSRVRLMLSIEATFGIEISATENSGIHTIGDLADLITSKRI